MIELKNVERSYKTGPTKPGCCAASGSPFAQGEFVTVMGPSGAGKSSLLNVLALLDDGWLGEYWFGETPVHKLNRKQRADLARAAHRHGLPELSPARRSHRRREHRSAAVLQESARQRTAGDGGRHSRPLSDCRQERSVSLAALRRAAAVGGHCARRGSCARAAVGRRANRQSALHAGARDHGAFLRTQPRRARRLCR